MNEYIRSDRALTPKYIRLIKYLLVPISFAMLILGYFESPELYQFIVTIVVIMAECLTDFTLYTEGIKNKEGTFLRTGAKGSALLENAIKGESIGLAIEIMLAVGIFSTVCFLWTESMGWPEAICLGAAVAMLSYVCVNLVRLITITFDMTRQTFGLIILFIFIFIVAAMGGFLLLHYAVNNYPVMLYVDIAVIIVCTLIGVFLTVKLINKCRYAFMCGFYDKVANDI